jgi:hypothetical protein
MFVRFRSTPNRLQVSLVETRRVDGKVRHQHVASIGSVPEPSSISDRLEFWAALHERLTRLSNRISAEDHHKLMAAIHERIPMAMTDEQRRLQRDNAEHDIALPSGLHDMNAASLADHKAFAADLARKIGEMEARTVQSAAGVEAAKDRLARIDRGEEVAGGLGKPASFHDILRAAGWTTADIQHCRVVKELSKAGSFEEYVAAISNRVNDSKRERVIARAILRRKLAELEAEEAEACGR